MNSNFLTMDLDTFREIMENANQDLAEEECQNIARYTNKNKEEFRDIYRDDLITKDQIEMLCDLFNGKTIFENPYSAPSKEEVAVLKENQHILRVLNNLNSSEEDIKQIIEKKMEDTRRKEVQKKMEEAILNTPLRIEAKDKKKSVSYNYDDIDIWNMSLADIALVPSSSVRRILKKAYYNYYIYLNHYVAPNMDFELEDNFTLMEFALKIKESLESKKR